MKRIIRIITLVLAVCVMFSACRKDTILAKINPEDFLSAEKYDRLIVEVQYVKGYAPTDEALRHLNTFLSKRLNKPDGISFMQTEIASPGKSLYSAEDIKKVEGSHRSQFPGKNVLTAYVLFLDGEYAGNNGSSKVLGLAYENTSLCIFEKTIQDHSGGTFEPSTHLLESAVTEHEFGHILGLVNNGTAMQTNHQDGIHGYHCSSKSCLMYYQAETTDIIANLVGGSVPELDDHCLADLRANGGK